MPMSGLSGGPVGQPGMSDWDHGAMGDAEPTAQGMTAIEVHAIVEWLETRAVVYQINGGWAVDALVGHQTRPHRDLDLFVDAAAVDDILGWLTARGYAAETDWLPARLELRSGPLRVDLHPMVLDSDGNGVQRGLGDELFEHSRAMRTLGVVSGRAVVVATATRLRELHEGYEPREVDVHDLQLLAYL
jgi:lincosamide nucleotidyltransferase A/C/D/E